MLNNKPPANYFIVGEKIAKYLQELFYENYDNNCKENIQNIKLYKHNNYGRKQDDYG